MIILAVTISVLSRPYLLAFLAYISLYFDTTLPSFIKAVTQVLYTISIKVIIEALFETCSSSIPMYSDVHGGDNASMDSGRKSGKASTISAAVASTSASGDTSGMPSGAGTGASGYTSENSVPSTSDFQSKVDGLLSKDSGCPKTVKRTVKDFVKAYLDKEQATEGISLFREKQYPKLGLDKNTENVGFIISELKRLPSAEVESFSNSYKNLEKVNDEAGARLKAVARKLQTSLDTNNNIGQEHRDTITKLMSKGKDVLPSDSYSESE